MVHFANGPLVTPERIVILGIFGVGISGSREDLVPERGVAVRVRNTVWWLSAGEERERHGLSGLRPSPGSPPRPQHNTEQSHMCGREK